MTWTWDALGAERGAHENACVELLRALLRIDTTNPPGREAQAAELLADELRKDKVEPVVVQTAEGRACVVGRIRGDGSLPPLLLAAHLDVVAADAAEWDHPPFAAEVHDGYIYGRGAVDMKNMAAMSATVVKLARRLGAPLKRDIIFAGVADEETGCDLGSLTLVSERPELVRAEYMLGEVGGFSLHLLGRTFYPIQVAEKGVCWVKACAHGEPGHGSMPASDSAVVKIAQAVAKLGTTRLPHHASAPLIRFLQAVAPHLPLAPSKLMPLLASPLLGYAVLDRAIKDPAQRRSFAALLANTATPTVLRAGDKTNVIPGEATVEIDGRTLPGQTTAMFLDELRAVLGPHIELCVERAMPPVEAPPDTPLFHVLRETIERHHPGAVAVPYMVPGFTDAKAFSRLGTKCYGYAPVRLDPSHGVAFSRLYHGNNERIPVDGLKWGLGVLWDAVIAACT